MRGAVGSCLVILTAFQDSPLLQVSFSGYGSQRLILHIIDMPVPSFVHVMFHLSKLTYNPLMLAEFMDSHASIRASLELESQAQAKAQNQPDALPYLDEFHGQLDAYQLPVKSDITSPLKELTTSLPTISTGSDHLNAVETSCLFRFRKSSSRRCE